MATKPSFREAFDRRRCLVPADGFYEWAPAVGDGGRKRPHWIYPSAGGLVSFAGIWETWRSPGGEARHTVAILTTDANADLAGVHHRMPVVVPEGARGDWLARDRAGAAVAEMLVPAPDGTFVRHEVSTRVNRVGEDDWGLVEAV